MKSSACWLVFLLASLAARGGPVDGGKEFVPAFDTLVASAEFESGLGFDHSPAQLDVACYSLESFLARPISLGGDWKFLPALEYSMTSLNFSHTPAGFPLTDEDLHQIGLHAIFYHKQAGSPWIYGGWGRINLASDFQQINGNDFYFDLAAGAGYMVNDRLMIGAGVAALQLGNDGYVLPGPAFYWKPSDEIAVNLIGALFNALWRPSADWVLAVRGRPAGSSWNIDSNNLSRQVDLRSYAVRLHAERRLCADLWLSLGVGYSFANQLELRTPSAHTLFKEDLSGGLSTSIGLRLRTW
ncbi:MAG: DUF6268 family outer membrane beta-barrel protein [Verrucomicrobiota bacterium]